jgi:heavy metal sensor kinase
VAVAEPLAAYRDRQARLRVTLAAAVLLGLVPIAAGGWWVAQRALRPVRLLAETAERIAGAGDLGQRIPPGHFDAEFDRVVTLFNAMMDRLQRSFDQASRFSADAAHELKTPLTILQGSLESAIQSAPDGSPEQERCAALLDDVQRLKSITQKLLVLALADAGQLRVAREPVDVGQLAEAACDDLEVLAPDVALERRIESGAVAPGDPDLLRQVVQNLTTNALQHIRPPGRVAVEVAREARGIRMTIANTAEPIPEAERERLFERFYRLDKARSRSQGGAGLGLSLSREIAHAHGGRLVLEDRAPDGMVAFSLVLPVASREALSRDYAAGP